MALHVQSWLVFGLSFLASAGLLGAIFISRIEIQYLVEWMQSDGGARGQDLQC